MTGASPPGDFVLDRTFFGIDQSHRKDLHQQIFHFLKHMSGAYTWTEIYNMPILWRQFYVKELTELLEPQEPQQTAATPNIAKPPA